MSQQAKAILLMVAIGLGHPLIGWSISPALFSGAPTQNGSRACVLDGTQLSTGGKIILAAVSTPNANRCLEDCARLRQRCEQQGIHRPGTKENIEWSKQCQGSYNQCRHGCN